MKKLIIAGLLAATAISAQAAPLRLTAEPLAKNSDTQFWGVLGSALHDAEFLSIDVKVTGSWLKEGRFHTISIQREQCARGIVRLRYHDVHTAKVLWSADTGVMDGTVNGRLAAALCLLSDQIDAGTQSTDSL